MITIGRPELRQVGEQTQLVSNITIDHTSQEMYYSVEKKYAEFLVNERVDAFVVGLLPLALTKNHKIHYDAPISEQLYFQLTKLYIPSLAKFADYHLIELEGEIASEPLNYSQAVGTGFSAGVDSFFSIARNTKLQEEAFNLTHLTFFNVGSHGDYGGDEARELFYKRAKNSREFAEQYDWKFIMVDSNISEVLNMMFVETHTFRSVSAVLAMQKLFAKYYYSSGFSFDTFLLEQGDTATFDLLNLPMLSTEDTRFYSMDGHSTRSDKVSVIAEYPPSYDYLNVCQVSEVNCGVCEKCRRTLLALYADGSLDQYRNVFDVDYFYKHKNAYLGYLLFNKNVTDYKVIIDQLEQKNYQIPLGAVVEQYKYQFKNLFRNNTKAKELYTKYLKRR